MPRARDSGPGNHRFAMVTTGPVMRTCFPTLSTQSLRSEELEVELTGLGLNAAVAEMVENLENSSLAGLTGIIEEQVWVDVSAETESSLTHRQRAVEHDPFAEVISLPVVVEELDIQCDWIPAAIQEQLGVRRFGAEH